MKGISSEEKSKLVSAARMAYQPAGGWDAFWQEFEQAAEDRREAQRSLVKPRTTK